MSIKLHPKHGLAPALTICPKCGKDTNEIALLGSTCNTVMRNLHEASNGALGSPEGYKEYGHNKIIASEPCDECKEKQKACDDEVKRGGVYWKCNKCGSEGAIKVLSDIPLLGSAIRGVSED